MIAVCTEKNSASRGLMEKLGMTRVRRDENTEIIINGESQYYTRLEYELTLA